MLIQAVRYSRAVKPSPKYVRKRFFKNFIPKDFVAAVKQLSWINLYMCEDVDNGSYEDSADQKKVCSLDFKNYTRSDEGKRQAPKTSC